VFQRFIVKRALNKHPIDAQVIREVIADLDGAARPGRCTIAYARGPAATPYKTQLADTAT
jgi:hypothetical protein